MTIRLDVQDKALRQRVSALLRKLTDPSPLMAGIAQELLTQTEERFAEEGPGWPQLAPSTAEQRGSAHPILQVTGALARSFLPSSGKDFAQISSNDPRAPWHFYGTAPYVIRPRNKKALAFGNVLTKKVNHPGLPARPMLPVDENGNLTPTALEAIMEILTVNFEEI